MINKAKASIVEMRTANPSPSKRSKWRRFALLGGVVVVILAIALDTKVVRIGSSEDLRQAAFSAAVYGAKTFPEIKAAIEARAVEAATLQQAIVADKNGAIAKYGVAGGSGPVFSVKFVGVAGERQASGLCEVKVARPDRRSMARSFETPLEPWRSGSSPIRSSIRTPARPSTTR